MSKQNKTLPGWRRRAKKCDKVIQPPLLDDPEYCTQEVMIELNKAYRHCSHCGHEEWVKAATAICIDDEYHLIFGSDFDFCTECDKAW